jgi:2-oxoglutarate ferredoxin oxidoreductase subunit delta
MKQKTQPSKTSPSKRPNKKEKKKYDQKIFLDWCKACGICIAFCPKKVYRAGEDLKPVIVDADACNGCLFCQLHCPDFAISIEERVMFKRRKTDV